MHTDERDQLKTAVRGGATVSLTYDYAGRKIQQIDPDLGTWDYNFDAMGHLTSQKDARCSGSNCVTTSFVYDLASHLTQKSYTIPSGLNVAATTSVNFTYDAGGAAAYAIGRRTSMLDVSGSTSWVYDTRGRVTQETKIISGTGGGTFVTQYGYNPADALTYITSNIQRMPAGPLANRLITLTTGSWRSIR